MKLAVTEICQEKMEHPTSVLYLFAGDEFHCRFECATDNNDCRTECQYQDIMFYSTSILSSTTHKYNFCRMTASAKSRGGCAGGWAGGEGAGYSTT